MGTPSLTTTGGSASHRPATAVARSSASSAWRAIPPRNRRTATGPKTTVRSARGNSSSGWGVVEEGGSGGQPRLTLGVPRSMYGRRGWEFFELRKADGSMHANNYVGETSQQC